MRKMRTFKRTATTLFSVVLALGLLGAMAIPAHAQEAGAVVFRGQAITGPICLPGVDLINDTATGLGVNPPVLADDCGANGLAVGGVLGSEATATWALITTGAGVDFCIGAGVDASVPTPVLGISSGVVNQGACTIAGNGLVTAVGRVEASPPGPAGVPLVGGWCGLSHGRGDAGVDVINGPPLSGAIDINEEIEWIASAGTVLPITDANPLNTVVVAGVVDAIGALDGNLCGLPDDASAARGFNVIGVAVGVEV